MNFRIRPAQLIDAPRIAHVQVESWKTTYAGIVPDAFLATLSEEMLAQRWQGFLQGNTMQLFVAEEGGSIFGFISGGKLRESIPPFDAELYAIYLLQSHHRHGAGRALIRALAHALGEQGFQSMMVWVLEANPAVGFYQHLGAIPVTQKHIHIGGVDLPELALAWPAIQSLL